VVGESVKGEFAMAGHDDVSLARWFRPAPAAGSVFLDLWQANQDQLRRAGVPDTHIFNAGLSTFAHPDWLESFRRDGAAAGRLVALVKVPGGRA
jgi:copper oxidase (laccase) domain-containing protein